MEMWKHTGKSKNTPFNVQKILLNSDSNNSILNEPLNAHPKYPINNTDNYFYTFMSIFYVL